MTNEMNISQLFTSDGLYGESPIFEVFSKTRQFQDFTVKQVVMALDIQASAGQQHGIPRHFYWEQFKKEIYLLLCTNNKRYSSSRKKLTAEGSKSQSTLIAAISGAIGAHLGIAAGVLTPFVILVLITMVKMGKNAFCEMQDIDTVKPFATTSDDKKNGRR